MATDQTDRATATERDKLTMRMLRIAHDLTGEPGELLVLADYRESCCAEAVRETNLRISESDVFAIRTLVIDATRELRERLREERERRVQAEKKLRAATAFGEVEERLRKEAEATIKSLAYMLGWENVPPRESLERNILENRKRLERAEKEWDRFKAATQTSRELAAEQGINVLKVKLLEAEANYQTLLDAMEIEIKRSQQAEQRIKALEAQLADTAAKWMEAARG